MKTPFNAKTVEIVHGIEDGAYKPEFANVKLYEKLF